MDRRYKFFVDSDTLYRLYITEMKTTGEISDIFHVCDGTICNWLRKYGIPIRQGRDAQRVPQPTADELRDMYELQELGIDAIAARLQTSPTTALRLMREYGIPSRQPWFKCAGANKGRPMSDAQGAKLSELAKQRVGPLSPRFGVVLDDETKQKISKSLVGRFRKYLHPNWKDSGIKAFRRMMEGQDEYKQWRLAVFARDNYTCGLCEKISAGDIQAHHIYPVHLYPDKILDVGNGITFCERCHESIRNKELQYIELFLEMVA